MIIRLSASHSRIASGTGCIPCLPGPAGELVAGGQGVGVLGTQDSLLDGQQGGEQVAGADRIPPLTRGAEG